MNETIVTKKMLFKEAKIYFRIIIGLMFLIVALFFTITDIFKYFSSDIVSVKNTIGNICVNLFILIVFAGLIGLKQIIRAISIIKYINSKNFIVEIDEVIDKYSVAENMNSCKIVFKYNKALVSVNNWKKIKKGTQYYIFNLQKGETIIKKTSEFKLDDFLKSRLVDYHINEENTIEDWEQ